MRVLNEEIESLHSPPRLASNIGYAFLASVAIGAQWFGLNPKYKKRELTYFIHDAEPRLVFTFPEFDGRNYAHELKLICQEADIQKNCNVIEFSGDSLIYKPLLTRYSQNQNQ